MLFFCDSRFIKKTSDKHRWFLFPNLTYEKNLYTSLAY